MWEYQTATIEFWCGKRGDKKGRFVGKCVVNLGGALLEGGDEFEVPLESFDSKKHPAFCSAGGIVLEYIDLPVHSKVDGWVKLHHSCYYMLTVNPDEESNEAQPHDPFQDGWIQLYDKDDKKKQVVTFIDDRDEPVKKKRSKPFKFPKGVDVQAPPPRHKKESGNMKSVSGKMLNVRDNDGNTALYYAVLHENLDMVSFLYPIIPDCNLYSNAF